METNPVFIFLKWFAENWFNGDYFVVGVLVLGAFVIGWFVKPHVSKLDLSCPEKGGRRSTGVFFNIFKPFEHKNTAIRYCSEFPNGKLVCEKMCLKDEGNACAIRAEYERTRAKHLKNLDGLNTI